MLKNKHDKRPRIGIGAVRASFKAIEEEPFCMSYFARPLANIITPFFFNTGFTADNIITLRLILGLIALVFFATGIFELSILAVVIFGFAFVLDCVDGNLSRLQDKGNYWGKFIDGFVDDINLFLTPTAIGCGAWLSGQGSWFVFAGAIISLVALLTGIARHRIGFVREWMIAQSGALVDNDKNIINYSDKLSKRPISIQANLFCFSPLLIILPLGEWFYIIIMLVFATTANLFWLYILVIQASQLFRRSRFGSHSIHSGVEKKPHEQ